MPHYRAIRSLHGAGKFIEQGNIFNGALLGEDTITVLLAKGKVALIYPPPLDVIPGWSEHSQVLKAAKINSVEQFLETPDADIAKATKTKIETVAKWRDELINIVLR